MPCEISAGARKQEQYVALSVHRFSALLIFKGKIPINSERVLAIILDRESVKWFKPAKGQFLIYYKAGIDHAEYQPDVCRRD
jgi:hypothetical protein